MSSEIFAGTRRALQKLRKADANWWGDLRAFVGSNAVLLVALFVDDMRAPICDATTLRAHWRAKRIVKSNEKLGECVIGTWLGEPAFCKSGKPDELWTEWCALAKLPSHRNVVRLYAACVDAEDNLQCLVLESAEEACSLDLFYIQSALVVDAELALSWCTDLAEGLAQLHAHSILHHDLHSGNVLMLRNGNDTRSRLVICDLGIAERVDGAGRVANAASNESGKPGSMAPEQMQSLVPIDLAADVWALGNRMCNILCEVGEKDNFLCEEMIRENPVLTSIRALANVCSDQVPKRRPTVASIVFCLRALALLRRLLEAVSVQHNKK